MIHLSFDSDTAWAPCPHVCPQAYQLLVAKHARVQGELRRLIEERGDAVSVGDHELFRLRDELAELVTHSSATADEAAELRCVNKEGW